MPIAIIALLLLVSFVSTVSGDDASKQSPSGPIESSEGNENFLWLLKEAERIGLTGSLDYNGQNVTGRFVKFYFDSNTGSLRDYLMNPGGDNSLPPKNEVIEQFQAEDLVNCSGQVEGDRFTSIDSSSLSGSLEVHNNPSSELLYRANVNSFKKGTNVTINLASDVATWMKPTRSYENFEENVSSHFPFNTTSILLRSSADVGSYLRFSGENFTVDVHNGTGDFWHPNATINATFYGEGFVYFYTMPFSDESGTPEDQIARLVANGSIGANIKINSVGGYGGYFHYDSTLIDDGWITTDYYVTPTNERGIICDIRCSCDLNRVILVSTDLQTINPDEAIVLVNDTRLDVVDLSELNRRIQTNDSNPAVFILNYSGGLSRYIIYFPNLTTEQSFEIKNDQPGSFSSPNIWSLMFPILLAAWTLIWSLLIIHKYWLWRKDGAN